MTKKCGHCKFVSKQTTRRCAINWLITHYTVKFCLKLTICKPCLVNSQQKRQFQVKYCPDNLFQFKSKNKVVCVAYDALNIFTLYAIKIKRIYNAKYADNALITVFQFAQPLHEPFHTDTVQDPPSLLLLH